MSVPGFTPYTGRRVALVTGAGQGIGQSIALRLASDGYSVALNDLPSNIAALEAVADKIDAIPDKESHPGWVEKKVIIVCADVSDESQVEKMVEGCVAQMGRLDIMIANAGITAPPEGIYEANLATYRRTWSTNVEGVLLCFKHASIQMIKQGNGGRIVGASSICGKKGFAKTGAYCSSKFAIRAITQCSALDLDPYGITVNSYAPGFIDTPLSSSIPSGLDFAKAAMKVPDAKTGSSDDIASWVSYVASPASQFMTGQTTIIDGGLLFD